MTDADKKLYDKAEELFCQNCKLRTEQCLFAYRKVNGIKDCHKSCGCEEVPAWIDGYQKGIEEMKMQHAAYRDISEDKIENLKDDVRALRKQIAKMRNCENCQIVRDANGNCYLHKDGKCDPKTKIKWEMKK